MAASTAARTVCESSSSEDEDLERLKEAVWNGEKRPTKTDGESNVKPPSRRLVVSDHQHDGNELQVTPEFRAHVAKKLEHMLDGYITEMSAGAAPHSESTCEDNDDGFRLFATSIPGQEAPDVPVPVRRRPIPSSSDSDSDGEMAKRLREAAVSVKDLLPPSLLPNCPSPCRTEAVGSEKVKKKKCKKKSQTAEGMEETLVPKKKKKRKMHREEGDTGEQDSDEAPEEQVVVLKKKKKKKVNQEEAERVSGKPNFAGSPRPQSHGEEEGGPQRKVRKKKKPKAVKEKAGVEALN